MKTFILSKQMESAEELIIKLRKALDEVGRFYCEHKNGLGLGSSALNTLYGQWSITTSSTTPDIVFSFTPRPLKRLRTPEEEARRKNAIRELLEIRDTLDRFLKEGE